MAEEKNFENKIKRLLKSYGCWFVKYWSGTALNGKKFTKDGVPDILVCFNGSFIGIEVKASNGEPSELQLYNLRKIEAAGGYGLLVYPEDYELLKRFFEEDLNKELYEKLKERRRLWEEKKR